MMLSLIKKPDQGGFTLIEVIVTIIAAAIVGVIFINFMGTAMSKSVRSVEMVQGEASAEATLERIIADYVQKMNQNNATALGLIKTDIDNKSVYGDNVTATYVCHEFTGIIEVNHDEGMDARFFAVNELPENIVAPIKIILNDFVSSVTST